MEKDSEELESLKNDLDNLVESTLEERDSQIPGMAVAVFRGSQKQYFRGFGVADIEKRSPIQPNTVFRLASISKVITTIALMQFWEKGKFSLDDPIKGYLPNEGKNLIKKNEGWADITFNHLLTHRSGIGELPRKKSVLKAPGFGLNVKYPKPLSGLSSLVSKNIKPDSPPDLKYAYCNFAYAILGYIVESFSGMDFRDYAVEFIFKPLEMPNSDFVRSERIRNKESVGYIEKILGKGVKTATYWQGGMISAGNLYSTVKDMANLGKMLLNGGRYKDTRILKKSTIDMCWEPHYYAHSSLKDIHAIGYTFHLFKYKNTKIVGHTGLLNGFTSAFMMIPEEDLSVMVFSNLGELIISDQTQRVKNLVIQYLMHRNSEIQLKEQLRQKRKEKLGYDMTAVEKIEGIYGSYPGILTNVRIIMMGAEFKVHFKENKLILKGLYGPYRKGKTLKPTENPYVFSYDTKNGSFIRDENRIVFKKDKNGKVTHMCWHLYQLPRKKKIYHMLRYRCVFILLILMLLMVVIAFF